MLGVAGAMSTIEANRAELPIVLLIDESAAMARPWGRDTRSRAEGLVPLVNGFLARLRPDPSILVALIGYATDASGRAEATSRWAGALAGGDFVRVTDVHASPLSVQARTVRARGEDGKTTERSEQVRIWYELRPGGDGRPQHEAFRACGERLEALAARGRPLASPVIVHVATGDSTDGDPAALLGRIGLSGPTVIHVHLASSRTAEPIAYPQGSDGPPPVEAKALWSLAGPVGEGWIAAAERAKVAAGAGPASLGIIVHAGMAEVLKLLKVVEALTESGRVALAPRSPSPSPEIRPEARAAAVGREPSPAGAAPPTPTGASPGAGDARIAWSFPPRAARGTTRRPLIGGAIVDRRGRLLACLQDRLVALSAEGAGLWSYITGGHIPGSPALGPDGLTRVHSADGFLHVVDPDGARVGPPVEVGPPLGRAAPVVDADGTTWICAATGGLLRIDADGRSGRPRLFYDPGCQLNSTPLIRGGVLYVGGEDDNLHAIPLGEPRGRNSWDDASGRGRTGWYINAAPAPAPGPLVVVPSFDEHLYAFRPDGTIAWSARLPGPARGSCVVGRDGRIYLGCGRSRGRGTEAGALLVVDSETAAVVALAATDEPVESTPVLGDDDVIYFGDNAGFVHAVDVSGRALWRADVGSPARAAGVIAAPGVVVFGLDDGTLAAVRCSSQGPARGGWPQSVGGLGLLAAGGVGTEAGPSSPAEPG